MAYEIVSNWVNVNFAEYRDLFIAMPLIFIVLLTLINKLTYRDKLALGGPKDKAQISYDTPILIMVTLFAIISFAFLTQEYFHINIAQKIPKLF